MKAKHSCTILIQMFVLWALFALGMPVVATAADGGVAINETNFPDSTFRQYVDTKYDKDYDDVLSADEIADVTRMTISPADTTIKRYGGEVSDLKGIEYFSKLELLTVYNMPITSLDLSGNPLLTSLDCGTNQLVELNVSGNPLLTSLDCYNNKLTTLDVSANTALTYLACSFNELTTLDLSKNTALTSLTCGANHLACLDLRNNTSLDPSDVWNEENTIDIVPKEDNTYDLSLLPGNFDVSRTCTWAGGSVSGTTLTINAHRTEATYYYDWLHDKATYGGIAGTSKVYLRFPETGEVEAFPAVVKLDKTGYIYDGSVKRPTVVVKDKSGNTVSRSNYSVTYGAGRKNVGKYKVTITFNGGGYSGAKELSFTIKPKGTSLKSVVAGKKKLTIKWKKQMKQTSGYQLMLSTSKKFRSAKTVTIKKTKTEKKTIKGLKANKKYYVRIRTYKTVGGKEYYSSWSKIKSVVTKK